jgi:hypothetical protein
MENDKSQMENGKCFFLSLYGVAPPPAGVAGEFTVTALSYVRSCEDGSFSIFHFPFEICHFSFPALPLEDQ